MWDLVVSSASETDIAKSALWYDRQTAGLGLAFIEEIEAVLQTLREDPERFRVYYSAENVRRVLTRQFHHHVYYYLEGHTVRVFAIVHAARHERVWRARL